MVLSQLYHILARTYNCFLKFFAPFQKSPTPSLKTATFVLLFAKIVLPTPQALFYNENATTVLFLGFA